MGRDWCLLAVRLEMADKVPKLDTGSSESPVLLKTSSQTARVLDEWERNASSTIGNHLFNFVIAKCMFFQCTFSGELIHRISEMGREDVVKILQAGCSIYRIITLEESMSLPVIESDDSLLIQQQQQQQHQNGSSD